VRNRFCTVCSGKLLGKSQHLLSSSRPAQQSLIPTKLAAVLAAQRPANERWQQSLGGHSGDSGRISCSFPFASGAPAVVLHPTIRNGRCRPQPPSPLSNAAFKFRSGLSGPPLFLAIHERADDDDLCQNRPPSFGLPVGPRGFPGLFPSATRTSILVRLIDGHLLASGSLSTHFLQSLSTFVSCAASHSTHPVPALTARDVPNCDPCARKGIPGYLDLRGPTPQMICNWNSDGFFLGLAWPGPPSSPNDMGPGTAIWSPWQRRAPVSDVQIGHSLCFGILEGPGRGFEGP
jgi:hypothetical protein